MISKYEASREKVDKSLDQLRRTTSADEGTLKGTPTDTANLPPTSSDPDPDPQPPPPPTKKRKVIKADNNNPVIIIQNKDKDLSSSFVKMKKGDSCWYPYCRNKRSKGCDLSFFQFPKDPQRRAEWCRALGMEESQLWKGSSSVMCSDHFEDKYFTNKNRKIFLKRNALPKKVPPGVPPAPPPPLKTTPRPLPLQPSIYPGLPPIFLPPVTLIVCGSGGGGNQGRNLITTLPTTSVSIHESLKEGEDPSKDKKKDEDKDKGCGGHDMDKEHEKKTDDDKDQLLDIYDGSVVPRKETTSPPITAATPTTGGNDDISIVFEKGDKLKKNPSTTDNTKTDPTPTTTSSSVPVPPQQSHLPPKPVLIAPKCLYQLPTNSSILYVPPVIPVIPSGGGPPLLDPPPSPESYAKEKKEQQEHVDRLETQVKRLTAAMKLLKRENRRFKKIKDQQKNQRVKKMSRGIQVNTGGFCRDRGVQVGKPDVGGGYNSFC